MIQLTGYSIFIVVIFLLLISWSLVTFWQRFFENLIYTTLGLDPNSTWIGLLIAVATTGTFLLIIWLIKVLGIIPDLDFLVYDYTTEAGVGGPLEAVTRAPRIRSPIRPQPRFRAKTIGRRASPRGALPIILSNQQA